MDCRTGLSLARNDKRGGACSRNDKRGMWIAALTAFARNDKIRHNVRS